MKVCTNCNQSNKEYHKQPANKDGLQYVCTDCVREYNKRYRENNKKQISLHRKLASDLAKIEGIEAYGGKCTCCGEGIFEFLTIEHLNGREKGKRRSTGKREWLRLKAAGWPKEDITILCFNCNCAKGAYGKCPHSL